MSDVLKPIFIKKNFALVDCDNTKLESLLSSVSMPGVMVASKRIHVTGTTCPRSQHSCSCPRSQHSCSLGRLRCMSQKCFEQSSVQFILNEGQDLQFLTFRGNSPTFSEDHYLTLTFW